MYVDSIHHLRVIANTVWYKISNQINLLVYASDNWKLWMYTVFSNSVTQYSVALD